MRRYSFGRIISNISTHSDNIPGRKRRIFPRELFNPKFEILSKFFLSYNTQICCSHDIYHETDWDSSVFFYDNVNKYMDQKKNN